MESSKSGAKLSKRDFLFGAVAGGCALQTSRWVASNTTFGNTPDELRFKASYAQSGEDLIVAFIFDHLKLPKPSYIDIGAHHPINLNNTYLFYLKGSRGVLVEPNVDLMPLLIREREGDAVLNVGIGVDTVKSADYYRMSESSWNTFSREQAEHCVQKTNKKVTIKEIIKMPLVNINEVFAQQFDGGTPDFLSIDIEGLDLDILKSINFNKHRPKVICVETLITATKQENSETCQFLVSKGYVVRGGSFVNAIFVDKATLDAAPDA